MRKVMGVVAAVLGASIVWLIAGSPVRAIDVSIGAVFGGIVCELVRGDEDGAGYGAGD